MDAVGSFELLVPGRQNTRCHPGRQYSRRETVDGVCEIELPYFAPETRFYSANTTATGCDYPDRFEKFVERG
jgi:hypothetical protein